MSYLKIKRLLDLLLSIFLLLILSPILLFIYIALLVSGEKRPIFIQDRIGIHAKTFKLLKFKTLKDVADKSHSNFYVRKNDLRVTRLGSFLRLSSLDELPQLLNILLGDMSFVGPRPSIEGHPYSSKDYPHSLNLRLSVPQGLTGMAQVSGRNLLSNHQKYQIDCLYAKKIGFKTDLTILIKTVFVLFNFHQVFDR